MEKIPTAEEIAIDFAKKDKQHTYTKVKNFIPHDWVVEAMKEFAKHHVKEALKKASKKAFIEEFGYGGGGDTDPSLRINKKSIIDSYPSENIK